MASPEVWIEALSTAKALFDLIMSGMDFVTARDKYRKESSILDESKRVSEVFSTFSDDEVNSITKRLDACRERFISEGSGEQRAECFCSVFRDVEDANGGIPAIDDWQKMFQQLCGDD